MAGLDLSIKLFNFSLHGLNNITAAPVQCGCYVVCIMDAVTFVLSTVRYMYLIKDTPGVKRDGQELK